MDHVGVQVLAVAHTKGFSPPEKGLTQFVHICA